MMATSQTLLYALEKKGTEIMRESNKKNVHVLLYKYSSSFSGITFQNSLQCLKLTSHIEVSIPDPYNIFQN
jgi:hypothetical protein